MTYPQLTAIGWREKQLEVRFAMKRKAKFLSPRSRIAPAIGERPLNSAGPVESVTHADIEYYVAGSIEPDGSDVMLRYCPTLGERCKPAPCSRGSRTAGIDGWNARRGRTLHAMG